MPAENTLLQEFQSVFGVAGGDILPGNVGESLKVLPVCRKAMQEPDAFLYDYFEKWDEREDNSKPFDVASHLLKNGQWEGGWALAQLHYDQLLKKEESDKVRLHKGHPLCGLALLARKIPSNSLTRHYALLSSAGDIYWKHKNPDLEYGGYGPTLLERFESRIRQEEFRKRTCQELASESGTDPPRYLEAYLAARWMPSHRAHVTSLANVAEHGGRPFVEVLLDAVANPNGANDTTTGARFEAAAGLLLSATPGFEVDSARKTTDEQIDLVVRYSPEALSSQMGLMAGEGLIECKSSEKPVGGSELRDFGAKCGFHRVQFGILITRAGITGVKGGDFNKQAAELQRRRFQLDGLTILVLSIKHLRDKSGELRGLLDPISADYNELVFGPVAGT